MLPIVLAVDPVGIACALREVEVMSASALPVCLVVFRSLNIRSSLRPGRSLTLAAGKRLLRPSRVSHHMLAIDDCRQYGPEPQSTRSGCGWSAVAERLPQCRFVQQRTKQRYGYAGPVIQGDRPVDGSGIKPSIAHAPFRQKVRRDVGAVFTDVYMSGSRSGLQLAHAIRRRWPLIHLIATSGVSADAELPPGSHFIRKPYENARVVALLHELLVANF